MIFQSAATADRHPARARWKTHLKIDSLTWWTWVSLSVSMSAALVGLKLGHTIAMYIAIGHAAIWLLRHKSIAHFPTQVRITFVFWMALSFVPMMSPLLWSLTAGTILFVLFGYCPIARMLLFLPMNRKLPLSVRKASRIIFHPPVDGSILDELAS